MVGFLIESDHCVSVEHCSQTLYMQNKPQRCDHISLKHTSETVPDMLDILDMLYNMLDMLYKPYTDHKLKTYIVRELLSLICLICYTNHIQTI